MTNIKMKEDELVCAKIFLNYLAKNYGVEYTARTNSTEDTCDQWVDVYADPDSGGDILKMQAKMIDREFMLKGIFLNKNPTQILVRDLETEEWIKREIEKCDKHYSSDVKKDTVLLLWTPYGGEMNVEYAEKLFLEYNRRRFKGIYFVDIKSECVIKIKKIEYL